MSQSREDPSASLIDLIEQAEHYLHIDCDANSRYAWPQYDIDPNPYNLVPVVVLAPPSLAIR